MLITVTDEPVPAIIVLNLNKSSEDTMLEGW